MDTSAKKAHFGDRFESEIAQARRLVEQGCPVVKLGFEIFRISVVHAFVLA